MDGWLVLSLTAAALWGAVSVVDKIVVEKHIPDPLIYAFFMGAYGLVSALVVGSTTSIHFEPVGPTLLAFLSGILYFGYIWLYFMALSRSNATAVVALGQITPLFAIVWGYLLLGEAFKTINYGGVISIVLGAVLISLECRQEATKLHLRFNAALPLMVAACLVRSLSDLLLKYPLQEINAWDGFFWPRLGIFIGVLAILACGSTRRQLWLALRQMNWRINLLIGSSETIALVGVLAITLAYEYGPLALVSASSATQPLFILLLVGLLHRIKPGMVPDSRDRCLLANRLMPLLLIIGGVYWLGKD
ncbi:MAG: EamA family transporter [Anaerolineae bacterium]|nr:EamA family transporter [Anaerolineae bacterium]